jgi:hypothetical protein
MKFKTIKLNMKKITLIFLTLIISILGFSQTITDEKLINEIEIAKNSFRNIGLKNLDKIEGIYHFKIETVKSGNEGDLAFLNGTNISDRYIIIKRSGNEDNRFLLWEYSKNYGNKFLQKTTNWFIKKLGNEYIISCSDCPTSHNGINLDFVYNENVVTISGNEVFFKEVLLSKYNKVTTTSTYTSEQKIFPDALGDNIFKSGTGFFISQNGYIITNYHVIEGYSSVFISNKIYKRLEAKVVFTDEFNDIAILKVNVTLKNIPYNIISSNKEIGNTVFTLGYPYVQSMGNELKLTNGIINSTSGIENDTRYYQFSAEIQPGNSGSPLFDSDGNIIGLVSAKHNEATNAGYALKSKFILDFIKINKPSLLKKNINNLKNKDLSTKYKLLKNYLLLIEVE